MGSFGLNPTYKKMTFRSDTNYGFMETPLTPPLFFTAQHVPLCALQKPTEAEIISCDIAMCNSFVWFYNNIWGYF